MKLISFWVGAVLILAIYQSYHQPMVFTDKTHYSEKPPPAKLKAPVFMDSTMASGLWPIHRQNSHQLSSLPETLGSGACVFDYNNDGWMDLLTLGGSGQTSYHGRKKWWQTKGGDKLYQNQGGFFEDKTQSVKLTQKEWSMGCAAGDLDNDGDIDFIITRYGKNSLYRNQGEHFTEYPLGQKSQWSTSVRLADYDRDGKLDIYVVNYIDYQINAKILERHSGFVANNDFFSAELYRPLANQLYHNEGDFHFIEKTQQAQVTDPTGRGLNAIWFDYNKDGWLDLWVQNDKNSANRLYINEHNGKFKLTEHFADARSTRSIAFADINNQGKRSFALAHNQTSLSQIVDIKGRSQSQTLSLGNVWSTGYRDFNNDGWIDLWLSNGYLHPDSDNSSIVQGQPNSLWLNQYGQFYAIPQKNVLSSRTSVFADFDMDGNTDIYVSQNNDLGELLTNQSEPHNWLGIVLKGNPTGIRVTINTAHGKQTQWTQSGEFLSQSSPRILFALKSHPQLKNLQVKWAHGKNRSYEVPAINQYWLVSSDNKQLTLLPLTPAKKQPSSALAQIEKQLHSTNREKLNAIHTLKNREDEYTVRWLLALFDDPSAEIQCAVSQLFGHWFDNEEAVIQRKNLAIPYLIRQLKTTDSKSQQCAIEALGYAENYRALYPLINLLEHVDAKLRGSVIYSLGQLREKKAIEPLIKHFKQETPKNQAQIIIALIRLDYTRWQPMLAENATARLLNALTQVKDNVLIDRQIVVKLQQSLKKELQ